ncbi:hypothetical protein KM043_000679 [Ampulex compressa]|nr:hypothetical protein KM043_000679 [Ampulex compressa]
MLKSKAGIELEFSGRRGPIVISSYSGNVVRLTGADFALEKKVLWQIYESATGSYAEVSHGRMSRGAAVAWWGDDNADLYRTESILRRTSASTSEIERSRHRLDEANHRSFFDLSKKPITVDMIKYAALIVASVCLVQSQRPPYAGTSNRYPIVLPQYLEERGEAVVASVANRIDTENKNGDTPSELLPPSTLPPDFPVDALGDVDLVNRIKTWPRDKQPFWYLNWRQIQEHRGDTQDGSPAQQPAVIRPNTRPSFAG